MPVALKPRIIDAPNRIPPPPAVPVGRIPAPGNPVVPVLVKCQTAPQLVARAAPRTPMPVHAAGVAGIVPGMPAIRLPVPVQIVAHRIQIVQTEYVNQIVVIPIIIPPLRNRPHPLILQHRIILPPPEVPRIILARQPVHIHIPAGVNPRVPRGRPQLRRTLALRRRVPAVVRHIRSLIIPIAVGNNGKAAAYHPGQTARAAARAVGNRAGGIRSC